MFNVCVFNLARKLSNLKFIHTTRPHYFRATYQTKGAIQAVKLTLIHNFKFMLSSK